jgi:DNA-binding NarL/FixJ family response regulator
MTEPIKILIVEDEIVTAHAIKDCLSAAGYHVVGIFSTAEEAVQAVSNFEPDLVLMDIKLQGEGDGVTASHAIHTHADVPVVYLTAHSDAQTVKRALHSKPYGYVLKPFREEELLNTVEQALEQHSVRRRAARS